MGDLSARLKGVAELEEMIGCVMVEVEDLCQRTKDWAARVPLPALLKARVVIDADAGSRRDLFPPKAGRSSPAGQNRRQVGEASLVAAHSEERAEFGARVDPFRRGSFGGMCDAQE